MAINAKLFLLCATAERPTLKRSGLWSGGILLPFSVGCAAAPTIISGSHEECGALYLWYNFRFGRKSNGITTGRKNKKLGI